MLLASAYLEGITHAILWSGRKSESFKWNEHLVFVFQRGLFALALFTPASWSPVLAGGLCYVMIHNGSYYYYRNKIDKSYPDGFWSQPTSGSTAVINFSVRNRIILFAIGLAVLAFALFYK